MTMDNPETKIMRHDEVYNGKIIDVHVDTVQLPSGKNAIREVVIHPGGVVAVPVLDDGRLILIRQFRYPLKKYILEFPAGKLDSQQSPLETIGRELEEETGYRARSIRHEFSFYTSPGISNELIHFFVARDLQFVSQHLEEGEHITVEIHSVEECLKKVAMGEITDGKTILGLFWYQMNFILK